MGLFDMFLSEERRIAKEQRTLTNRDKQPEDREACGTLARRAGPTPKPWWPCSPGST